MGLYYTQGVTVQIFWKQASVTQSDVRPTGDQEVLGSIPAGSGNILSTGIWLAPFFQQKVYEWPDLSGLLCERPHFLTSWYMHIICVAQRYRSTFRMIKYMNGSVFFKDQIYEWGRFWNTGSHTRTKISTVTSPPPRLPPPPPPPLPPPPPPPRECSKHIRVVPGRLIMRYFLRSFSPYR